MQKVNSKESLEWFKQLLSIDSTSGKEDEVVYWLCNNLKTASNKVEVLENGDGVLNVRCSWGKPRVFLCTHCDTVPPFIPPVIDGDKIKGRGACDAKGQIFSMFQACLILEEADVSDFGLLILSGEETGSFGAKAYNSKYNGGEAIIVGEPTDNKMVAASKGTQSFAITIKGRSCHSGYPELGSSAINKFVEFVNALNNYSFPVDEVLGETTWNIGELKSDNKQNILSPEVYFRIYFRTTFVSAGKIKDVIHDLLPEDSLVEDFGGDQPLCYLTFDGFPTKTVAFGSDAPRLTQFKHRILCGPGSITVAHTQKEFITLQDIKVAVEQYISFVKKLLNEDTDIGLRPYGPHD